MASVSHDANGTRRILFVDLDGARRTVRLGTTTAKDAESMRLRVESLLVCKRYQHAPTGELADWVARLPDATHAKLAAVGLVVDRAELGGRTLGDLLDRFESSRSVKPGTLVVYRQATASIRAHLGEGTRLDRISAADADDWRKSLSTSGLASATIAKRVRVARGVFAAAVRWGWLASNPFASLRAGSQANPARLRYIDVATIGTVLDACPNTAWRAIVALSRFAGLRCPSEHAVLRWDDVLWDRKRLTVRSPKTEGHDGGAVRVVPLDDRLAGILLDLFAEAEPGSDAVLPMVRDGSVNLRTGFERILRRAGVAPWPRLFHNLRSSCEMDWVEHAPAHAVAAWLGHSPTVAATHYLHVRDAHFDRITSRTSTSAECASRGSDDASPTGAQSGAQSGAESGAESGALGAQKAAQYATVADRRRPQNTQKTRDFLGVLRPDAMQRALAAKRSSDPKGIRTPPESRGETGHRETDGAESGAESGAVDAELAGLIAAWPDLPAAVRAGILAMVRASG